MEKIPQTLDAVDEHKGDNVWVSTIINPFLKELTTLWRCSQDFFDSRPLNSFHVQSTVQHIYKINAIHCTVSCN